MGIIQVNGIQLQAFHGCLEEEGIIGGNYVVNVQVEGDFSEAETADALGATIDYSRIAAIVREQMAIRSKLIEHVCRRILTSLKGEWHPAYTWRVQVTKLRPPIHGNVDEAVYVLEG